MADSDAIVFPDEVEAAKAAAKSEVKVEDGDSNTVEEAPTEPKEPLPQVGLRNMIVVPPNCPPGQQMGADGVCRVVFN